MSCDNPVKVDLEAMRCPNAQIMVNRVLANFIKSDSQCLHINSIEPSLYRSIKQRVAHYEIAVNTSEGKGQVITEQNKEKWLCNYDEEDFSDVTMVNEIILKKQS
ncbi:MAG: hypothetical protein HAW67_04255 [Endozoicomonadaceae bacterium]|nr:hypothetical protein [Endozoicomonadaceae bacterium]